MRKLVWILVGFAFAAHAQTTTDAYSNTRVKSSRRVVSEIMPVMDLTGSTLDGSDTQELDGQKYGVGAGIRLDIGRSDFVFETGVQYRQLGGNAYLYSPEEARQKGLTTRFQSELELNYLSVPLMAKYYLNGHDNSSFFVRAGLQPSYLVYKEARLKGSNNGPTTGSIEGDQLTMINDFDLLGAGGFGVQIMVNETTLAVFEGTYLRGFTSVLNNTSLYHNSFSFSFGLGILL